MGLTYEITFEQRLEEVRDKARNIMTSKHSRQREQKSKSPEEGHAWIVQEKQRIQCVSKGINKEDTVNIIKNF